MNSKCLILMIGFVFIVLSGYSQSTGQKNLKRNEPEKDSTIQKVPVPAKSFYYTCPVHTRVRVERAGNCPQCGMTLNKKFERVYYACPQHSDVKHDNEGQCEKCGVVLEEKK